MAYDFTADSSVQEELSKELNNQANDFENEYKSLYSEIDGLSGAWVGEDYDAFQEGTHGYETALGDLKNGIDLFSKHFARMSIGTDALATELIQIIQNATEGGTGAGAGDSTGSSDGSTPGETTPGKSTELRDQTNKDGTVNPYGGKTETEVDSSGNTVHKYYDDQGNLKQMDKWNEDGKLIKREKYDENGDPTYQMYTNIGGSYVEEEFKDNKITSYKYYDADGNLEKFNEYDENENLIRTTEYEYDANNNLILKTTNDCYGTYCEEDISNNETVGYRVFDTQSGNLLFENYTDAAAIASILAAGGTWQIGNNSYTIVDVDINGCGTTITYNIEGNKISKTEYYDSEHMKTEEKYDDQGNVIEKNEYDEDGQIVHHYETNEDGELTEVTNQPVDNENGTTGEEEQTGGEQAADGSTGEEPEQSDDSNAEQGDVGADTNLKNNYDITYTIRRGDNCKINYNGSLKDAVYHGSDSSGNNIYLYTDENGFSCILKQHADGSIEEINDSQDLAWKYYDGNMYSGMTTNPANAASKNLPSMDTIISNSGYDDNSTAGEYIDFGDVKGSNVLGENNITVIAPGIDSADYNKVLNDHTPIIEFNSEIDVPWLTQGSNINKNGDTIYMVWDESAQKYYQLESNGNGGYYYDRDAYGYTIKQMKDWKIL